MNLRTLKILLIHKIFNDKAFIEDIFENLNGATNDINQCMSDLIKTFQNTLNKHAPLRTQIQKKIKNLR